MEQFLVGFQSSDTKLKVTTAENFLVKLKQQRSWLLESKNDLRLKVMSSSLLIINDTNPKVVMLGLDILQCLLSEHRDYFQPLINMTFDTLITKFSDPKVFL